MEICTGIETQISATLVWLRHAPVNIQDNPLTYKQNQPHRALVWSSVWVTHRRHRVYCSRNNRTIIESLRKVLSRQSKHPQRPRSDQRWFSALEEHRVFSCIHAQTPTMLDTLWKNETIYVDKIQSRSLKRGYILIIDLNGLIYFWVQLFSWLLL